MIIKASILLLLCFSITNSYAQKTISVFNHEIVFGKVMQVTETGYENNRRLGKAINADSIDKQVSKYDIGGNIIERVAYIATNWKLQFYGRYNYLTKKDIGGNKVEILMKQNDKELEVYKFNEQGYLTESNSKTGQLVKWLYHYDASGNPILIECYDVENNLLTRKKNKYNKTGNIIEEDSYTDGGTKFNSVTYYSYEAFDKMGNWLKRISTNMIRSGGSRAVRISDRQILYY